MIKHRLYFALLNFICLISFKSVPTYAQAQYYNGRGDEYIRKLATLGIEELLNQEVTSVSKKEQALSEAAAAVFVITQEDIRRSGATSVPEILRMVPGVHVARVDSNQWAISARGSNDIFANKLLVLIDGKTVYNPLFGGVYWDVQDTLIEDIERIEVIRGPGATLYGANAVNGVINIITKRSSETTGGLISTLVGSEDRNITSLRYGGSLSEQSTFRAYAKGFDRDNSIRQEGDANYDDWQSFHGGFRIDSEEQKDQLFTLQGDAYMGRKEQELLFPSLIPPFVDNPREENSFTGANLLGQWSRRLSERSDTQLQAYYDYTEREDLLLDRGRHTLDIDFKHRYKTDFDHEFVWGLGYRYDHDDNEPKLAAIDPPSKRLDVINAYIQDEIAVVPEALSLTIGSKIEHNEFTGVEWEPSARFLWRVRENHSIWGAVSRSIRTPTRAADGVAVDIAAFPTQSGIPNLIRIVGNPDLDSESHISYELGYRVQPYSNLSFDLATHYSTNKHLNTAEPQASFIADDPTPTHIVTPLRLDNNAESNTYGLELLSTLEIFDWWHAQAGYTFIKSDIELNSSSNDPFAGRIQRQDPEHWFNLRCLINLPANFEFDTNVRYVDSIKNLSIESYIELDLRLGYKFAQNLEVSLVGQNLLHDEHAEFASSVIASPRAQIERAVYGKLTWRF